MYESVSKRKWVVEGVWVVRASERKWRVYLCLGSRARLPLTGYLHDDAATCASKRTTNRHVKAGEGCYLTGLHSHSLLTPDGSSSYATERLLLILVKITQVTDIISMATRSNLWWMQMIAAHMPPRYHHSEGSGSRRLQMSSRWTEIKSLANSIDSTMNHTQESRDRRSTTCLRLAVASMATRSQFWREQMIAP
jgi:hypothetical protein